MYKINCLNPIAEIGLERFTDDYQMVDDYNEADGVLVRSASMHDMDLPENLKVIARAGAGVNNIPLDKCAEKGIVVFNTPGANANGVKEAVIAGLLLASRDIVGGVNWVQSIRTEKEVAKLVESGKKRFAGIEIQDKKIGVIGLGAIGVRVANACSRLNMEVYGYDPYVSVDNAWNLQRDIKHVSDVNEIYQKCDFITVHVPLTDGTKGMINKETIAMMKDDVVILNFARDLLVNEDDLGEALASGKVKKYVTDFPNDKTANMEGVLAIPHLGASTEESEDNCAKMAVKQMKNFLEHGNIKNSVNFPACDMGMCKSGGRVAVCHRNVRNMIAQLTTACAGHGINIEDMINKSRNDYAYTMLDLGSPATDKLIKNLEVIEGVLKVRVIK